MGGFQGVARAHGYDGFRFRFRSKEMNLLLDLGLDRERDDWRKKIVCSRF
jgi:hypothetical protein